MSKIKKFYIISCVTLFVVSVYQSGWSNEAKQVFPDGGHSVLECNDCHQSANYREIDCKTYNLCAQCHKEIVEDVKKSSHKGLGAICPDTGIVSCLKCHNPHQGIIRDGQWQNQVVAAYNKYAFKFRDVTGTEHSWRSFDSINDFCLDCHGAGNPGKTVDISKVSGELGTGKIVGYKPYPDIEGLGDERGALPMDHSDFIAYNIWKMEKAYWGNGNASYGTDNYNAVIANCTQSCHSSGYLFSEKKYVGASGYQCDTCHPKNKEEAQQRLEKFKLIGDRRCTQCHMNKGSHTFQIHK